MDLIERYLASVRILLPQAKRDDIIAELRDVLMGCREEQAAQLSRPLTQEEEECLLREFGHPVLVAGRYGPQQYLIGPDLYPVYTFVLKLVLAIVAVAAILVGVVSAVVSSDVAGAATVRAVGIAWHGAFSAVGAVTVTFAILQRYSPRLQLLTNWRARDLPALRTPRRTGWFDHVAGIAVNVVFLLWWTNVLPLGAILPLDSNQSVSLALAPVWQTLYWPVVLLAIAAITVHGLRLMRDGKRRFANMLDLALQLGILAVAGVALHASHWAVIAARGIPENAVHQIEKGVNIGLEVSLIVVICVAIIRGTYDVRQLVRPN
jgi:hypothetical protein